MSQFSHHFWILSILAKIDLMQIKFENCKFYCMQSHNMILALLSTSIFAEFADYRIANVRYFRHKTGIPADFEYLDSWSQPNYLIFFLYTLFATRVFSEAELGGGWWLVKFLMLSRFIKLVFMAPSTKRGGERNFTLLIISFLRVISHDQGLPHAVLSLVTGM